MDVKEVSGETPINAAHAPALVEWENPPNVQVLQGDLEASKPAHDTFVNNVRRWNDLTQVTGKARPKKVKGRSAAQPKLIRRQAEWRYSALTEPFNSTEKMFQVDPTTFEDGNAARQNDRVLNWQFRSKINRVKFIDDYVRSCVDEGTVIVRTGWKRTTVKVKETVPVWDYMTPSNQEDVAVLQGAIELKEQNPREYNETVGDDVKAAVDFYEESGTPSVAVQNGVQEVEAEKVLENKPTLDLINVENFFFDPSCGGDLEKAGFIIVSFETSQAELKKEPKRYKNLEYVNWEGASTTLHADHAPQSTDNNFNFKDALRKRVVAYEYWGLYDIHKTGELVPIVATWIEGVLVRMEENPFPDGKPPFVVATYMPIKRQVMGEPDAELLEDNQKILGAVTRGMIDLLGRSANGQQGFAKGMLDTLNRRRYEEGADYEFNPNMPPSQGVLEHKYPDIPQSAMLMLQLQNQEAEALTGVKAFSGGLSGDAYGEVAAGIKGILDAAAKREMAILRRLAAGLVNIGKKFIAMNAEFLSEEETVRVTNEEFIIIKREELHSEAGEFDMKVDISTAEIDNNKAQDLGFLLQTTGNTMDFGVTKLILLQIARLKRMPELAKLIEEYEPQPDPLNEELKKLQIEHERLEIEKLKSEIKLNHARALKEETVAEATVLDTVEQETGTKHARDLEKQTAQSTGNQNLEVTKSLLKSKKPEESNPDIAAAVGFNEFSKRERDPLRGINEVIDPALSGNTETF
jgi:hypothetical protein